LVNEQPPFKATRLEGRPPTPIRFVPLVEARPGELNAGLAVARSDPVVDRSVDGDQPELAQPVGDVR